MNHSLCRDEEAVSAAVATVLLFGGVLSIIGLMMVSMMPVIEELQGSVERHDMSAQMALLASQTADISERGMPGDSTSATLVPVDGSLIWDSLRGGMWYSATWSDGMSLRARSMLDFDDQFEIRHPETFIQAVCVSDLRQGPDRLYYYDVNAAYDTLIGNVKPGLAVPLGPIHLQLMVDGQTIERYELRIDELVQIDATNLGQAMLASSHEMNLYGVRGEGGTSLMAANDESPANRLGQSWSIPLTASNHTIQILSDASNQVTVRYEDMSYVDYAIDTDESRTDVSFTLNLALETSTVVHISTSEPSRLVVISYDQVKYGVTQWPSQTGQFIGREFSPPHLPSTIRLTNPTEEVATATWRGGGISVQPGEYEDISWPQGTSIGPPRIDVVGDLELAWSPQINLDSFDEANGMMYLAAHDTGRKSGGNFSTMTEGNSSSESISIYSVGYSTRWNLSGSQSQNATIVDSAIPTTISLQQGEHFVQVEQGHPIKILWQSGTTGMEQIQHNGQERCTRVEMQASGWITTDLPWERMGGRGEIDITNAWKSGRHPSSMSIEVIGVVNADSHGIIGTVWAFHLSRLSYQFQTSIQGMEVAYTGGAVVTNHPEFNPYVVIPPSDRGGPGPRFAATIPSLHPTQGSASGAGILKFDIELVKRESLASTIAWEVRRGWSDPYGTAIADYAGVGLEASEDWTVAPGQLDLLTDYVGWVPDPTYGTAESVWHTNGEAIQFTLQLSSLDVTSREVLE